MIDERAVVDPGAQLAPDVSVGPFSVIGPDVIIGAGSRIGPHVVIQGPTRIGRNNQIFQFASVGEAPQDLKYAGEPTRLEIGDNNVIREFATLSRGTTQDHGVTRVGNHCLLMAYTHVAHDCQLGDHVIMSNAASLGGHVRIGDWAILGGFAMVHQFCRVGAHAFLGMGAAVSKDVPPYLLVAGNPARPHGVNSKGLSRRGFDEGQMKAIRHAYRLLFRHGMRLQDAVAEVTRLASDERALVPFVEFFADNERSLVR